MKFRIGKPDYFKAVKIAVGCCLSIAIATLLGLRSSSSAGIITLLSIQNTKRETLRVALKRGAAFFAAILTAAVVFPWFGYQVYSFGIFLFAFVLICCLLRVREGISMSAVLTSHLWSAGEITPAGITNEFLLLCIGVGIGILINLFMPRRLEAIRADQQRVDAAIRSLIGRMSDALGNGRKAGGLSGELSALETELEAALLRAKENQDNTLLADMRYYTDYMEMRRNQCVLLRQIAASLPACPVVPPQSRMVAGFMENVAATFHEYNNAAGLESDLLSLRAAFKETPLPRSREEFETRAALVAIVNNLEYLIRAKKHFTESLAPWEIQYFWKRPQAR